MTNDRISINGEWYIRESSIEKTNAMDAIVVTPTEWVASEYCFEDYRWEAKRMFTTSSAEQSFYPDIDIEFYDRGVDGTWNNITEYWENPEWFRRLLAGSKEAIAEAKESMSWEGVQHFIAFLRVLESRGWLKQF